MENVGDFEYSKKDLIGHGAFAVVFKGRHKKHHDQVVAIKSVAKKNIGKSQQFLGKEIKILQEVTKLHHKNVVALLECVETPSQLYIVIEYCNGGDLSEYLTIKGTLSEDTIRLFLRQIAEAVKVLNAKGVVHRDLKPQNILLCHAGKANPLACDITLKIADFGFARFLQDGNMAATLCGSPMYMAPEVIMSLKYDAKADLWSIGTIVFQCLTGKAPFMAPNPPALKQFYEKNANLAPRIPSGTSVELTELMTGLMKRDAKDRLDFDQFFNHPFLKLDRPRSSSPVPVPSRRSMSPERMSPSSPISPYGSPSPQCWDREVGGEDMAQSPSPTSSSPLQNSKLFQSGRHQDSSPRDLSPSSIEQDFVMISHHVSDDIKNYEQNRNASPKRQRGDSRGRSPCKVPVSNPAFRKSGHNTNINMTTKAVSYQAMKTSSSEESSRPNSLPMDVEGAEAPATSPYPFNSSEAYPVPRPSNTYEEIEHSLQNTPVSSPHDNFDLTKRLVSPGTSPTSPKDPYSPHSEPIAMRRSSINSIGSDVGRMMDIHSFTPPAVQFTIGTPPSGGRLRSYSAGTPPPINSGRQTPTNWRHQVPTPPLPICGSPLRRSGNNTPPVTSCVPMSGTSNSLSPVLGSPSKDICRDHFRCHTEPSLGAIRALDYRNVNNTHYQMRGVPFGGRTMTLPEFNTKDLWPMPPSPPGAAVMPYSQQHQQCHQAHHHIHPPPHFTPPQCYHCCVTCYSQSSPVRARRYSGTTMYTDSSPTNHAFFYANSPQNSDGHFVAPELTEETLLEREHNETLAKLNFVSALVKCILELAKTRGSPLFALLTDSISRSENTDQVMSEGYQRAIQLLLYMKALQLLSTSLQLSQQEVKRGNLQPSYAVRSVLHVMKEQYHFCLSMCKTLNTPGLLQSVGMDANASNITADKILYNYAIEMCQSAALEELLGEPKESFRRYQTAQILLHSLSQQVNDVKDKELLHKYRHAVEKRLTVLSTSGYAYAYDTP